MTSRPLHTTAGALTAVHEGIELVVGTGVIGAGTLGFPGALAASAALDGGWLVLATRDRPPDRVLAFLAGLAVGIPLVHFALWPWERRWGGVPVLTEAEGLPHGLLGVYTAVLYAWAGAGAAAVVRETPRRHRPWALVGVASVLAARPWIESHFRWMAAESSRNPQWWNRAWR